MDDPRKPLFVPVRQTANSTVTPQLARLPEGPRTGLAFTSSTALAAACRPGQPWIRLSEGALRDLLSPLGVTRIQVDPTLIVADLAHTATSRNVPERVPAHASGR